jgi:quercetin dioxygenase-like cupin family protein
VEPLIRKESAPSWSSPAPGVRVRPLVEGAGTGLMLYQIEPGTRFQLHAHPFPELGLIISGAGVLVTATEERPAAGGDSYYFPASMEHGFRVPDGRDPVVLLDVSSAAGPQLPPTLEEIVSALKEERPLPPSVATKAPGHSLSYRPEMNPAAPGARARATGRHPPPEPVP